jgi:hypothetical protein
MLRRRMCCLIGLGLALPAQALSVRPLSLDEMVDTAAIAFEGTCIENRTEREEATQLVVTYTTFAVKDVLKGDVSSPHVIKQIGGELSEGGASLKMSGVPKFAVGQDYVVLLAGVSAAGFSSPVGLGQGRFTVRQDVSGKKVSNGRDFREMTTLPPGLSSPGARAPVRQLGLEDFKQLVRARAGKRK